MTARCVSALGFFGGRTKPGDAFNATGYYENTAVEDLIVSYLRHADACNLGRRFQPFGLDAPFPGFACRVLDRLYDQGYDGARPFFYKDTKTPLVWPLWDRSFPQARWVLVERNRRDTLASIRRAPFMTHYETERQWAAYLDRYDRLLTHIRSEVASCHTVNADALLAGDRREVQELSSYLERPARARRASAMVDPSLCHSTAPV